MESGEGDGELKEEEVGRGRGEVLRPERSGPARPGRTGIRGGKRWAKRADFHGDEDGNRRNDGTHGGDLRRGI